MSLASIRINFDVARVERDIGMIVVYGKITRPRVLDLVVLVNNGRPTSTVRARSGDVLRRGPIRRKTESRCAGRVYTPGHTAVAESTIIADSSQVPKSTAVYPHLDVPNSPRQP
jgi:hypothetical protein